ncbi:hypothetical protein [Citrobacter sp. CK207]|uniref:hypothetical protein n=1 Tax=Citrobacter sp. CK207 TaxID=2985116 RepID=UPI0025785111|nr:hypothetical protein [Citrobacter sp. CK207]MDM2947133.1 hypothetical protein [Citrobacter sp. CK207]
MAGRLAVQSSGGVDGRITLFLSINSTVYAARVKDNAAPRIKVAEIVLKPFSRAAPLLFLVDISNSFLVI